MKKPEDDSLKYDEKTFRETEIEELRKSIVSSHLERSSETDLLSNTNDEFLDKFRRLLRLMGEGTRPPIPEGYRIVQKEKYVTRSEDVFVVQKERRFLWRRWWEDIAWHYSEQLVHEKTIPRLRSKGVLP